jgi:hypothetical protein
MSRRHHGGRSHRPNGHGRGAAPLASTQATPRPPLPQQPPRPEPAAPAPIETLEAGAVDALDVAPPAPGPASAGAAPVPFAPPVPRHVGAAPGPNGHDPASQAANGSTASAGCTAPQLRRFIKSRPYVPMHELRRRFGINGTEDDVTVVEVDGSRVFVGLPAREGGLLGELLRGGEVGYELSLDPRSPVVVGLYPMRPVPRT